METFNFLTLEAFTALHALVTAEKNAAVTSAGSSATSAAAALVSQNAAAVSAAAVTAVSTDKPVTRGSLLDFSNAKVLDPRITFSRASVATYWDRLGNLKTAVADQARFNHDPTTGKSLGLLIERATTNKLLNTDTLATQNVTVAAGAHTLTFYGTGSITLSGTGTGTLAGTGAKNRVQLKFTATAGTLTVTVTGSVRYAQLEAFNHATSYIASAGTAASRATEVAYIGASYFADVFGSNGENSILLVANSPDPTADSGAKFLAYVSNTDYDNNVQAYLLGTTGKIIGGITTGGVQQASFSQVGTVSAGTDFAFAMGWKTNDGAMRIAEETILTDSSLTVPPLNRFDFGSLLNNAPLNGHILRIEIYPKRLSNTELTAMTRLALLTGSGNNQAPTVQNLADTAFVPLETLAALLPKTLIFECTGSSRSVNLRFPNRFNFSIINSASITLSAQPAATGNAANTDFALTFNGAAGKTLIIQITYF